MAVVNQVMMIFKIAAFLLLNTLFFLSSLAFGADYKNYKVSFAMPYNKDGIKQKYNEVSSRLYAKSLILKKYKLDTINFPDELQKNHKKFIIEYIHKGLKLDIKNFKKINSIVKGKTIYFNYSGDVITPNKTKNINVWKFFRDLINKEEINLVLSLDLALSYKDHFDLLQVLRNWKKKYKGGILYITSNNLINNPMSLKYIDKNFKVSELSSNLEETITLFDMAPFNLDICLQTYEVLIKNKFKILGQNLWSSCKTVQSKKIKNTYLENLKKEKLKLKQININIKQSSLINKIFEYGGNLPIQLSQKIVLNNVEELNDLIYNFEKKPNLVFLKKIRNKLSDMGLNLITGFLTNQIGVSQNATYKY